MEMNESCDFSTFLHFLVYIFGLDKILQSQFFFSVENMEGVEQLLKI